MNVLPPIPGRRVAQIAAIPESGHHHSYGIFTLCEDGSVWENFYNFGSEEKKIAGYWEKWEQIPPIPGDAARRQVYSPRSRKPRPSFMTS
jgi:hypothetical protein